MILKVTDILMDLTKCISKKRLCHSIGVMQTAYKLAEVHGADKDAAIIAGILHDYAKEFEHKDMIKLCKENDIKLSDHELKYPNLIHGKAASCIAKNKYGINDEDILQAIMYHTTGKPGMSKLGKIIYLADYIEPNRESYEELELIRKVAYENLDKACYLAITDCIDYLKNEKGIKIDDVTWSTFEYLKSIAEGEV